MFLIIATQNSQIIISSCHFYIILNDKTQRMQIKVLRPWLWGHNNLIPSHHWNRDCTWLRRLLLIFFFFFSYFFLNIFLSFSWSHGKQIYFQIYNPGVISTFLGNVYWMKANTQTFRLPRQENSLSWAEFALERSTLVAPLNLRWVYSCPWPVTSSLYWLAE